MRRLKRLNVFTNMEAKLAAYRRRKEEEKQAEHSLINKLKSVITNKSKEAHHGRTENSSPKNEKSTDSKVVIGSEQFSAVKNIPQQNLEHSEQEEVETELDTANTSAVTRWTLKTLKVLLWLTLWKLFIELQFGAVFFSVSVLVLVYFNTRTGPRDNKPSAYSVFNKDCERIQGTLTAEQMQRQMFGVPGLPS